MLIGGQIALTLLMMAGAGAAIEGFLRVAHMNLGYDPHNVMSVGIPIHDGTYKTWAERAAYFEQIREGRGSPRRKSSCRFKQRHSSRQWIQYQI